MTNKNYLARLPTWISHWLGYRRGPPKKIPDYQVWFWTFVAAFCGLSVIQAIFGHTQYFVNNHHTVPIVASFGASAVLCYGAIEVPFSQPRALIFGHFFSALIGVCIAKLFHLLPTERYEDLEWLAASLATSIAIVVMQITKTTHPPAGATALLPATNSQIWAMSWYFLPVVLLSSMLVLATALLINNLERRYPVFWISPVIPAPAPPIKEELESSNKSEDPRDPQEV